MSALQTEGVTAGYGKVPIINDITVSAEIGKVTTIIGPNGAGKTTLLQIAAAEPAVPKAPTASETAAADATSNAAPRRLK